MNKIFIPHQLVTLNEYIKVERSNRYAGAKIKKDQTELCSWYCRGVKFSTPTKLRFTWTVSSRARDCDNVAFSKKFILDAMCKMGVIPNDNLTHITGLEDVFIIDKNNVGVCIEVIE